MENLVTSEQTKPEIHVDVFGTKSAPAASQFGKGATDRAEIEQATKARRDLRPGDYYYAK